MPEAMMLPVFVPYTIHYQPTLDALGARHPTLVQMDQDTGYLLYFHDRWNDGADFINVEHDVVVLPGQLDQMDTCPEPWCCFNEYDNGPPTLSIARFRRAFMEDYPYVWLALLDAWRCRKVAQPPWTRCDSWLTDHCGQPHKHESPHVWNVRPYGSLH